MNRFELANFLMNNKVAESFFVEEKLIRLEDYDLDISKGVLVLKLKGETK